MNEPFPPESTAPLPSVGNGQYTGGRSQPWSLSSSSLTRQEIQVLSQDAIIAVSCDSVSVADHHRCMIYIAWRRCWQFFIPCALIFIFGAVFFSVIPSGRSIGIGLTYAEELACFALVIGVIFLLLVVNLTIELQRNTNRLKSSNLYSFCFFCALPQGIYDLAGTIHVLIPWEEVRSVWECDGDIFVSWSARISPLGLFYFPRRGFIDQEQAQRFHQALTALKIAKGSPEIVLPEVRAEFILPELLPG